MDQTQPYFDPATGTLIAPEITVTGDQPPQQAASWWPWLVAGGVLAALWWLTREDKYHGPLVGGAG